MSPDNFDRIQWLNDAFRKSRANVDDDVYWPPEIARQGREFREAVLKAIRDQSDFSHDETFLHDFGAVVVNGQIVQWSIENRSAKGELVMDPELATLKALVVELE